MTKEKIKNKKESLNKKVKKIIDDIENVLCEAENKFMYTEDLNAAIERLREWILIEEDGEDYYFL